MVWDFLYLVWMERRRRRHRHQKDQVKNKRIIKHWNEPANERTNESALLLLARCWIAFRLIAAAAVANLKRKKNKIKGPAGIDKGNQRGGSVYRPFCCAWWVGSVGRSPAQTNERQNQLWWWHIHTHTHTHTHTHKTKKKGIGLGEQSCCCRRQFNVIASAIRPSVMNSYCSQ